MIVDGCAALAIILPDEMDGPEAKIIARAVFGAEGLFVPAHWWAEVANGVHLARKRNRISPGELTNAFAAVQRLDPFVDDEAPERMPNEVISLAQRHNLTIYDAAYLELALRKSLPLATLDKDLRRAAVASGVVCIP
jgi:predicted nucleic acid-binding protein